MAIVGIVKSFSSKASKLRLPFRLRPKPKTTDSDGSSGGVRLTTPKPTKEDEFRQVFRYFDANDDGMISAEELRDYFISIGESVSVEEAVKMIKELSNTSGDGEESILLDFGGFMRMMESGEPENDADKVLRQVFEVYEVEKGSGCITAEGLRRVFRRLGEVKSYQECEAMIRFLDLDGNGVLDFHEFHKMMT